MAPNYVINVMGVCGSGKSTTGETLAAMLGLPFVEGDDLHPESNVAKMASGQPLDDDDRVEFLQNVGSAMVRNAGEGVVVSCSALKKSYRDLLRTYHDSIVFVMIDVAEPVLRARLTARKGHFMSASMLDSQLAILEKPDADERAILVDGTLNPAAQARYILESLMQIPG
jgi:carbohydrate kinase (thermoresistant glucokinase family)